MQDVSTSVETGEYDKTQKRTYARMMMYNCISYTIPFSPKGKAHTFPLSISPNASLIRTCTPL